MKEHVLEIVVALATVLGTVFAGMQVLKSSKKQPRANEAKDWQSACREDTAEAYQSFLDKWGDGPHSEEARNLLEHRASGRIRALVGFGDDDDESHWLKPGDSFSDFEGAPDMVVIPSGSFMMGSCGDVSTDDCEADEQPLHEVTIEKAFAVGKYPVTFDEWETFHSATSTRRRIEDEGWGAGRRPIIKVSWDRAQEFVEWLSTATSKRYRLLSEAEWEYCCRAGSETDYSTGETISLHQACYDGNRTEEVGRYGPNDFGLHDMHGNVWEWCEDLWHSDYFGAPTDGSAWLAGGEQSRLVRGGAWDEVDDEEHEKPFYLRSAVRYPYAPATRRTTIGFRVAREL